MSNSQDERDSRRVNADSDTSSEESNDVSSIPATRVSRMWARTLPALLALTAILILVAQNSVRVTVRFLGGSLRVPLAVALLGAVILGAFVVLTLGSARVMQLRRRVRTQGRLHRHQMSAVERAPDERPQRDLDEDEGARESGPTSSNEG